MGWRWWGGVEWWEGGIFEDLIFSFFVWFERLSVGVGGC